MLSFKLDVASAAREAAGSRITEPGAYTGTFKQCYLFQSTQKKSNGVRLSFQSDSGEKTDIELYVSDAQGKPFLSMQTINALMMVMKVKEMNPQEGKVMQYDYDEKKEVETTAPVLRELMNKPIGLLLNMEGQVSKSGKVFYKPVIVASFDPATVPVRAHIPID